MQQSDYEIVGKFGFESRTHRIESSIPSRIEDFLLPFSSEYLGEDVKKMS